MDNEDGFSNHSTSFIKPNSSSSMPLMGIGFMYSNK